MEVTNHILSDYIFQCENLFPLHNLQTILAICPANDPFLTTCLHHKEQYPTFVNICVPEWHPHVHVLQTQFSTKYTYSSNLHDISIQSYSAIYIDTKIDEHSKQLINGCIQNTNCPVILCTKSVYSTLLLPSSHCALPICPNLFVIFPCASPLDIQWLPTIHSPYNFNSSILAIDKQTFEPTMIETGRTTRIHSVRASHSKFSQSDLVFLKDGQPFGQPILCNPTCREDLRFFVWKKQLYGSYTYITPYIAGVPTYQKLVVGQFQTTDDSLILTNEWIPPYGHNLTETSKEANWIRTVEKNWT